MSFGGFLGMGAEEYAVPWTKLTYDTSLRGYRTDITRRAASWRTGVLTDRNFDWSDRAREEELHQYYFVRPYWGA
jgi:hypothetical protein